MPQHFSKFTMPSSPPDLNLDLATLGALTDDSLRTTLSNRRSLRTQAENKFEPTSPLTRAIGDLLGEWKWRLFPDDNEQVPADGGELGQATPVAPHTASQAEGAGNRGAAPPVAMELTPTEALSIRVCTRRCLQPAREDRGARRGPHRGLRGHPEGLGRVPQHLGGLRVGPRARGGAGSTSPKACAA